MYVYSSWIFTRVDLCNHHNQGTEVFCHPHETPVCCPFRVTHFPQPEPLTTPGPLSITGTFDVFLFFLFLFYFVLFRVLFF